MMVRKPRDVTEAELVVMHLNNLTTEANLAAAWEVNGEKHEALNCRRRLTELKPETPAFHAEPPNLLVTR